MSTGVTTKHLLTSESLDSWATSNNLGLLYDVKKTTSFSCHRWSVSTNPDLAFASFGQDSRLPDKRGLGKFLAVTTSALITPPKLKVLAHSDPVKRKNFERQIGRVFAFSQANPLRD